MFFFFKQKTAYEMRISDWSSDVCSSDLDDGYPDSINVTRRLFLAANNGPDHYETFRPKLDGPFQPAIQNENKQHVANEAYKDVTGAVLVQGNIPRSGDTGVHSIDDVVLQAPGPGSEGFKG